MSSSTFNVVYSFGDSLSDAGNVWLLSSSGIASTIGLSPIPVSPPYAQLNYGTLANVFSNGPVWPQYVAASLGLPFPTPGGAGADADTLRSALTPPIGATNASATVTALELKAGVPVTGNPYVPVIGGVGSNQTDFAIGGALAGPTTENSASTVQLYDLQAQLRTFEHDIGTPAANALATVSVGGDDVIDLVKDANFATTLFPAGTTLANVGTTQAGADVQQSVSLEVAFLTGLIADGFNDVAVMNVPDIGKIPAITALGTADATDATVLSQYYDQLLSGDVAAMNTGEAHVAIVDAFTLVDNAVSNPTAYGLQNVTSPVYSGSSSNFVPADLVSSDLATQNTYLFFDTEHPTETGNAALANLTRQALGIPCFAAGTRILTVDGEVPVERLRTGARVVLADGGLAPVVWIGHDLLDCTLQADPRAVWPVCISAGAFGPDMPERDLYLSPDHSIAVDGMLVPVRYLVKDRTIVQTSCAAVDYFHVELRKHAVLLADGLPAESYLDTGNRGMFTAGAAAAA
jgi:phospholipase/lecithinase/hemolysin